MTSPGRIGRVFAAGGLGLLLAAGAACSGQDDGPRTPLGQPVAAGGPAAAREPLSPAAQQALSRGNDAFRAKQYRDALAAYRDAAAASPHHPAPWFGVQMAATALGDSALADSAMRRIRALTPDADTTAGPHGLPPGHPTPGTPPPTPTRAPTTSGGRTRS